MPQALHFAVCLCDGVTLSDFIPPVELLLGINFADHPEFGAQMGDVPYRIKFDYLAPELKPVTSIMNALTVNPTKTYKAALDEGIQYDGLWVPAGPIPDPKTGADLTPLAEVEFVKVQAQGAKYVMSVCGGSMILASAGVLSGHRATTNKSLFRLYQSATPKDITWVAKARWVVDGKIWTSSGVSAGSDMALAFIEHLVGPQAARIIRGRAEVYEHKEEDDPFAEVHGLA